jgi:drug/metabolite transporter (DMT)-like permease
LAALGLFYSAMARGTIVIVAPVAASGAVLPVLIGFARGDAIGVVSTAGIVLALAGALGAAWEPAAGQARGIAAGALLAAAAAVAVGLFFTLVEVASRADPYWSATIARTTACVLIVGYVLARRRSGSTGSGLPTGALIALAAIGITDALAEILFAVASTVGELGVVAVLSSMYPVLTVALAFVLLRERVHWLQSVAAGVALAGVVVLGYAVG